jgi:hypothetical protein
MTRAYGVVVAVVCGVCLSLLLVGCEGGGGDDGNGDLAGFPDVRGVYSGTFTSTARGCVDPADNGTATDVDFAFTIFQQSGAEFRGGSEPPIAVVIVGQITRDGDVRSTWTANLPNLAWQETHIGTLTGDTWTAEFSGRYTRGDTCVYEGQTTATRQ